MYLKCNYFNQISKEIKKNNKKIVMFGVGVIGQIIAPQVVKDYGLLEYIDCYIDNDIKKWKNKVSICGKTVNIKSPEYLQECSKNTVIMLNISRFYEVLNQLAQMECTSEMDCYIFSMLCVHNYCLQESIGEIKLSDKPLIPKKIHYMWLGKKMIPDSLKKCIESWKRYCPDYEIIEWNEDNYDVSKHPYMEEAYEAGDYGFVPDYARLDILYTHGGIYMDTDEELFRSLDTLLYQEAFCGVEKWQDISFGACAGSIPGHPMVKKFLDARESLHFINSDGSFNRNTCGFYDTPTALNNGYMINGKCQTIGGLNIYGYDYFVPYDYMTGVCNKTKNTYSVHWYSGGWLDDMTRRANRVTAEKYEKIYRKCLAGEKYEQK
ncbi:hypothetical protein IJ596_02890 [bacterium]|nr:hypothetical protein [bacterium]